MKRYFICEGDQTTAGGTVLEGMDGCSIHGKRQAVEGAKIYCPACKREGIAANVPPYRPHRLHGKQALLDNDICLCGCRPPPRLIASQDGASMSFSADELAAADPDSGATVAAVARSAPRTINASGDDVPASDASTPLGGARPFTYSDAAPTEDDPFDITARGVSEGQEAECFAEYERNIEECNFYRATSGDAYTFIACKQNAFNIYNQCRGY